MRRDGWAEIRKKAILVSMLGPCKAKDEGTVPLDHFVLEMQQLDVLRSITGFDHHEDWKHDVTCIRFANSSLSGLGCTETADDINIQNIVAEEQHKTKKSLTILQEI
jgi:hypothetical protein